MIQILQAKIVPYCTMHIDFGTRTHIRENHAMPL